MLDRFYLVRDQDSPLYYFLVRLPAAGQSENLARFGAGKSLKKGHPAVRGLAAVPSMDAIMVAFVPDNEMPDVLARQAPAPNDTTPRQVWIDEETWGASNLTRSPRFITLIYRENDLEITWLAHRCTLPADLVTNK